MISSNSNSNKDEVKSKPNTKENSNGDVLKATSKDYYFDSYSHFGIHEEMLKDKVRTWTYRQSILQNKHLFKGKVVLDVGCGTGILSLFAAQAGAKQVFAVDCASIADQAKEIVKANGFDHIVTVIRGKIEDLELPVDKVDVIISEWMGYFLLYESMLDTVLYARDKWLVKGGVLLPDKANMYICGIEDAEYKADKITYWENVYGFDMSCIKELALTEPLVDIVPKEGIMTNIQKIFAINLNTVSKEELDFNIKFKLRVDRNEYCHALVVYFDVEFSRCKNNLRFSTGPRDRYTHWKQTVFYLDKTIVASEGDEISGTMKTNRNKDNPRDLDIKVVTNCESAGAPRQQRLYRLR